MIALAIVVLFGPDKLPEIARGLGEGVRKMRGAMEDVKTEIFKESDNPVSEIKREIEKVKKAAQDYDPVKLAADSAPQPPALPETPQPDKFSEDFTGPVSR